MIALAYVIPVIACLLLKFEFDYDGGWAAYLWVMLFGEGTVGALHYAFYRKQSSRKEYLGSLVYDIVHEDSWVELVEVSETRTDRNGRTYTVRRIEERYHPERYYFHTTRGSAVDTDYNYYCYVRNLWGLPCNRLTWSGSRIRGGMRFGEKYDMADFDYEARENPANWVPVTECHKLPIRYRRQTLSSSLKKSNPNRHMRLDCMTIRLSYGTTRPVYFLTASRSHRRSTNYSVNSTVDMPVWWRCVCSYSFLTRQRA